MGGAVGWRCRIATLLALTAVTFLPACAPRIQPFEPAPQAKPVIEDHTFLAADAAPLASRRWLPEHKPKAVILALHGMNDYSHAFEGTGKFFSKHGVAVYAYDQRGFGKSPDTGIWAGEENLKQDLKQFVLSLKHQYPHTPIYVLGESMGGAVAIVALSDPSFPRVDGVVLSAPAVWGNHMMPLLYRGVLWTAAHTIPYVTLNGKGLHIIASNNYPMLRALAADPLVIKDTRIDAIYGMVELMDDAYGKVSELHTRTLLLYGAHDQVIPAAAIESARKRFAIPFLYAYYPKGYHLLLRDLQAKLVMMDILYWIRHPDKTLPSGFGQWEGESAKAGE